MSETPPPPPRSEGRVSSATMIVLLLLLLCLAALLVTVRVGGHRQHSSTCGNRLSQLWKQQFNYSILFGGPAKTMPVETGSDFWLKLTRTSPPLQNPGDDVFRCPVKGGPAAAGCDYRGPASDVNAAGPSDPIGADKVGNHGKGGNVLLKSGSLVQAADSDAAWRDAALKTRP